ASDAPLSPPPSAIDASFNKYQGASSVGDKAEQLSGEGDAEKVGYMHAYSARYARLTGEARPTVQARSSTSHPNVRFAADPVVPAGEPATSTRTTEDYVSSWPTFPRANGILERVWGHSHHPGRSAIRSSRSVGGFFRAATSYTLAEQATARV
ncbi:unnamed protein product, partial [Rhizoctonia solani]